MGQLLPIGRGSRLLGRLSYNGSRRRQSSVTVRTPTTTPVLLRITYQYISWPGMQEGPGDTERVKPPVRHRSCAYLDFLRLRSGA